MWLCFVQLSHSSFKARILRSIRTSRSELGSFCFELGSYGKTQMRSFKGDPTNWRLRSSASEYAAMVSS